MGDSRVGKVYFNVIVNKPSSQCIVSRTASRVHTGSRRSQTIDLCAPEETLRNQGGIWSIVLQGETVHLQDMDKENDLSVDERMLGKLPACSFYLINLFPEFQIPYLCFCSHKKKKAG